MASVTTPPEMDDATKALVERQIPLAASIVDRHGGLCKMDFIGADPNMREIRKKLPAPHNRLVKMLNSQSEFFTVIDNCQYVATALGYEKGLVNEAGDITEEGKKMLKGQNQTYGQMTGCGVDASAADQAWKSAHDTTGAKYRGSVPAPPRAGAPLGTLSAAPVPARSKANSVAARGVAVSANGKVVNAPGVPSASAVSTLRAGPKAAAPVTPTGVLTTTANAAELAAVKTIQLGLVELKTRALDVTSNIPFDKIVNKLREARAKLNEARRARRGQGVAAVGVGASALQKAKAHMPAHAPLVAPASGPFGAIATAQHSRSQWPAAPVAPGLVRYPGQAAAGAAPTKTVMRQPLTAEQKERWIEKMLRITVAALEKAEGWRMKLNTLGSLPEIMSLKRALSPASLKVLFTECYPKYFEVDMEEGKNQTIVTLLYPPPKGSLKPAPMNPRTKRKREWEGESGDAGAADEGKKAKV